MPIQAPRGARERTLEDLIAYKRARLRLVAGGMGGQQREGDLSDMVCEHDELASTRERANGETLD